ncbi:MAG: hypothetical protein HUU26_04985 [Gemmatimonadaceae bacterium]|nr:hypothetical protein [Gemmatimonadaceae bacterium]
MTDPGTFTAEHRSFEWDLVLRYEEGSVTPSEWNEALLTAVAGWYARNLTRDQATTRYRQAYERNHRRLTHRRDGVQVATDAIEAVDRIRESILETALGKAGK